MRRVAMMCILTLGCQAPAPAPKPQPPSPSTVVEQVDVLPQAAALVDAGDAKRLELDFEAAMADYDSALELVPQHAPAFQGRGLVQFALGDYEKAGSEFERALELDPNDAILHDHYGRVRYELDDAEGAIAHYTLALEIDDELVSAFIHRGSARAVLKRYESALNDLQRALELLPPEDRRLAGVQDLIARAEDLFSYHEAERRRRARLGLPSEDETDPPR